MKLPPETSSRSALSALLVLSLAAPLRAVELADLAGDWTLAEFRSPTALREIFYNQDTDTSRTGDDSLDFAAPGEILTYAFYPSPLLTETRSFNLSPTGQVTGNESGTVLSFSSNRLLYSDGSENTTVYSNTTGDVMLTSQRDEDEQNQTICLKRPSGFTIADAAGPWHLISSISPGDITRNIVDGRLADVYFIAESSLTEGQIIVNGNGTFNGLFSGGISGTPDGNVTVTTGGGAIPFRINASANVMTATPGDEDEQEYVVMVRKPASLATADLAGTWRVSAFKIPTALTETYYNQDTDQSRQADSSDFAQEGEVLVDVFHTAGFELMRQQVFIDSAGNIAGTETGTLSANGDKSVSVVFGGNALVLHPNANKTVMIGTTVDEGEAKEIIIVTKTSETVATTFDELVDLKTVETPGQLVFSWNSSSNLKLEASSTLSGFSEVTEASGGDAFAVDTTGGGSGFFRISERPEEPE